MTALSLISGPGDTTPNFSTLARSAFASLVDLGFEIVSREPTQIRFEKADVFLSAIHEHGSHLISVEIGRIDKGDSYSLFEVLSALAPSEANRARCQSVDPVVVESCLMSIADTIERNCLQLLAGDTSAFDGLSKLVSQLRRTATLQAQWGPIIDSADRAWDRKDWASATPLYEQAASGLDEVRKRRLTYLRKRQLG